MAHPQTFDEVLAERLREDPSRPLVTFYDGESGERVDFSVATYANWVAKAAGLLVDELDLERGDTVRVDLPPHWLTTVFLGAAWTVGLVVTGDDEPDAVVCGPGSLARWASHVARTPVLASALLPLGARFPDPLPEGVHDVGVEIWSQPDLFTPLDPPTGADAAHDLDGEPVTQADLWSAAATGTLVDDGGRLLSEADPASSPGLASLTEPLRRRGSLVLVSRAGRDRLEQIAADERATARFS